MFFAENDLISQFQWILDPFLDEKVEVDLKS